MKILALMVLVFNSCAWASTIHCGAASGELLPVSRAGNLQTNKGWIKAGGRWLLGLYTVQETCRDQQSYFVYRHETKTIGIFRCDNGRLFADPYGREDLLCQSAEL